MRLIFTFIIFIFTLNIQAQDPRNPDDPMHLSETGRIFEVKIFPGTKETKIFVIGKKAAQINFNKLEIEAILTLGQEERTLTLKRSKDHYVTSKMSGGDKLRLKLKMKDSKKLEEFNINLKP